MKLLITGSAGFIGFHLCQRLLAEGHQVTGFDNFNDYYDPQLKQDRSALLEAQPEFELVRGDLGKAEDIRNLFDHAQPERVIHLAAQAGVRYSIDYPDSYLNSNLIGFHHIIEACRHHQVEHLVYASSSSVYGANTQMPFSETHGVDHPVSLYAATKRSNELVAHSYAHLYGLPSTGLRLFTVYGPWGRPDMALFKFTARILAGEPIDVYGEGHHQRDFTYIDDIIDGVVGITQQPPLTGLANNDLPDRGRAPYRLYNIGNHQPVELMHFIQTLEKALGRQAEYRMLPQQPGDVAATHASIEALSEATGFKPATSIETGIGRFVEWYRDYYRISD